jgi:aryl-alcohol dehydrogenase-like predicted oxidoreductase
MAARSGHHVRKRPLGKTGLVVSELALGTWGLSGDGYGPVDEGVAERVIERALAIGVTTFDTADAYGAGKMEAALGKLACGVEGAVVITKVGIDRTTVPPQKRFDRDHLTRAVTASHKRLGGKAIDVVLLHSPTPDALREGSAVEAIVALKEQGLVAHWGVSAGDVEVARAAVEKGAEVVELTYNLFHAIDLHRLAGELMVAEVGVLARSTLGYGLLAGMWTKERVFAEGDHRRDRWTTAELGRRIDQLNAIRFLVKGDIHTMRGAAVRFVLANHLVDAAVLGPRSVEQLEQLIREIGSGPTYLPDDDLAALPRILSRVGVAT